MFTIDKYTFNMDTHLENIGTFENWNAVIKWMDNNPDTPDYFYSVRRL